MYVCMYVPYLGRHESALKLLDKMVEEDGLAPDEITFSTLIHACGRAGEWEKVRKPTYVHT